MRHLLLLALLFAGCSDILPVHTVDLCKSDKPPSRDCPQCQSTPYASGCPQCLGSSPNAKCANAPGAGSGGQGGTSGVGSGGKGGSGGQSSSGGSDGGGTSGDAGGSGGTSGSSGAGGTGGSGGKGGVGGGAGMDAGARCHGNGECDATNPECDGSGQCVACSSSAACNGRGALTLCDDRAGSPTRGACVQCLAHADCTGLDKPECNAPGQCVPCSSNDDACTGRPNTTHCDNQHRALQHASKGSCVQCVQPRASACFARARSRCDRLRPRTQLRRYARSVVAMALLC